MIGTDDMMDVIRFVVVVAAGHCWLTVEPADENVAIVYRNSGCSQLAVRILTQNVPSAVEVENTNNNVGRYVDCCPDRLCGQLWHFRCGWAPTRPPTASRFAHKDRLCTNRDAMRSSRRTCNRRLQIQSDPDSELPSRVVRQRRMDLGV